MTEVASLILKADSTGVVSATGDLDKLTAAAGKSERATDGLAAATTRARNAKGQFIAGVGEATKGVRDYGKSAEGAAGDTKSLAGALDDATRQAKMAGAIIGGLAAGALTLAIRNTMRTEQVIAQLDAAIESTGGAAGYTSQQLREMADEMSRASTFSSNDIIEAQTRMLSYSGIVGENVPRAMQAVIDQGARLNMSLTQSAETIGRALESPSKAAAALAQQGFGAAFTDEVRRTIDALVAAGREGEAQIMILEILEESYAGAAQAARDTFGGALSALKNTLGDLISGRDGSLEGARTATEGLIDTLNDPGVQQGFQSIVSGAMKAVEWLARFASTTAGVTRFLGEEIAARVAGPALDNTVRIEQAIERQRRVLAQMDQVRMIGDRVPAGYDPLTGAGAGRMNDSAAATAGREQLRTLETQLKLSRELAVESAKLAQIKPPAAGPTLGDLSGLDLRTDSERKAARAEAAREAKRAADEEARAAQQLANAYDGYLSRLQQAIELQGENTNLARVNYEIQSGGLKGISEAMAEVLREAAEWRDWQEEMAVVEGVWAQAAQERTDRMIEGWNKATDEMSEYARQAARNIQSHFADFLFNPFEDGLSGMLRGFADTLRRMAAEAAASKLFDALGNWGQENSGNGGWAGFIASLGSFFGGGNKAAGGPLMAGQGYIVGDGGNPELFVPNQSGTLHPMARGTGGGNQVVVNVHNAPAGTRVEQKQTPGGGLQVDVMLDGLKKAIAGDIATGGPTAAAIKGRFGLREA